MGRNRGEMKKGYLDGRAKQYIIVAVLFFFTAQMSLLLSPEVSAAPCSGREAGSVFDKVWAAAARFPSGNNGAAYNWPGLPGASEDTAGSYRIPKTIKGLMIHYLASDKRFYVSDANGSLLQEAGLYVLKKQTAGGVSFPTSVYYIQAGGLMPDKPGVAVISKKVKIGSRIYKGCYYYARNGRLAYSEAGLIRLSNVRASDGTVFHGYYYRDAYGKLAEEGNIRRISNGSWDGIYYIGKKGKILTKASVQYLSTVLEERTYKGYFCFGGIRGSLQIQKGLTRVDDKIYYVANRYGKCLTNAVREIDGKQYTFGKDGSASVRQLSSLSDLKKILTSQLKKYDGEWSVYVKNLDTGESFSLYDTPFYAASLVKPFLLAALYDQVNQGKMEIDEDIEDMCRYMITYSDNNFFNELVYYMGHEDYPAGFSLLNKYLKKNGYAKTRVYHTLSPSYVPFTSISASLNSTCVSDCGLLLERIYKGTCVNKTYSDRILGYLLEQTRTWKIPAGVPAGVKVANKTGETDSYDHDMAIVYAPRWTYILCICSGHDYYDTEHVVEVSRTVYQWFDSH